MKNKSAQYMIFERPKLQLEKHRTKIFKLGKLGTKIVKSKIVGLKLPNRESWKIKIAIKPIIFTEGINYLKKWFF